MASPLVLREGDPPRLVELDRRVADALAATGALRIAPTLQPDFWEVAADRHLGVIACAGLQVVIQPKLDIQRLVFLMGYARRPDFWRDDRVLLDAHTHLPEALAIAFLRLTNHAVSQGLLKGYRTVDETLPVLRGRVREADQLRHRWGRSIPLEVRYDEFTVDIPENRILLAATEQLLLTPHVGARVRGGLQRLRVLLADVSPPKRGGLRPTWLPSRLNARYTPALTLAELILDGNSFEQRLGEVTVSGYLFNMASIFEDFVTIALREALAPLGGHSSLQYRTHLDVERRVPIRPDFVWSDHGLPRVVVDAKYKAEKPSGFPQADLYQMLAYCMVLGLDEGHLIYAQGEEPALEHRVQGAGIRITAHTLDLTLEPSALLGSMATLASRLVPSTTPVGSGHGE